jgi:predicted AlkP superfamily phosphohydrolase/phosphomutase
MREGRMLSGLGVPELRETNSTFTYVGTDVTEDQVKKPPGGGVMVPLKMEQGKGTFVVEGPSIPGGDGKRMALNAELTVDGKDGTGTLKIGAASVTLHSHAMSDWLELDFEHGGQKIRGIGRAMLLETGAQTRLFITPLSMHPRAQYSPFTYPRAFGAQLADEVGLYKTVGWDHDTSALNAEVIDDGVFLADMNEIETQRRKMLMDRLAKPDWDLLIWVSTATDRVAHMFYRLIDPEHPRYDAALAARHGNAIEREYRRMDETIGRVVARLRPEDTLLIMSDHGFHNYRRGLHVNQWLRQNGLLTLRDGAETGDLLAAADWSQTQAYALGTGQIYLNRRGREPTGIVSDSDAAGVMQRIREGLMALRDTERGNAPVVTQVYLASDVFQGGRSADAPDMQIAFAENYRTSWETILGGCPAGLFADNTMKWSGDHSASDVRETPGILISNRPLIAETEIIDLAPTALRFFAKRPPAHFAGRSVLTD